MAKKKAAEVSTPTKADTPTKDKVKRILMAPGDVVHIFVTIGDGREVDRVVRAGHDGSLNISAAPEPAALAPDPISDPPQKASKEEK